MKITGIKWLVAGCVAAGSLVLLASWQNLPAQHQKLNIKNADTIPQGRDLEKELQQLSNARKQLENLSKQDFSAMQQQLQESLAQLDQNKIQLQVDKAMKEVNIEQSLRAAEEALKKIDLDGIMDEVNAESRLTPKEREKVRQEISKAKIEIEKELKNKDWKELKEVDMKEVEKELQKARIELEEARKEMGENGSNIRKELADASKDLDEAEAELKGYQELIYRLESAKLLDTKKDYSIEWNAPGLKINGQLQSKTISESYKKYFKDDKTLIRKENGKMNIRKGDDVKYD
jgi:chromosome segregation ATPase